MKRRTDRLRYVQGDATFPEGDGPKIIAHICNDVGAWGRGFVLALSRRWPEPAREFKEWYQSREAGDFKLGAVQFVQVGTELWVANMVAQHGLKPVRGTPPIRYEPLEKCLQQVAMKARELEASIHMPRIGCGLAGGKWDRIEPIITATVCEHGTFVTVYDLP